MASSEPRREAYPALLSYGFRPFFLLGSIWAALAILIWLPMLAGRLETRSLLSPVDWHAHELLFGYLVAVVTGFLLTAIPNWTGRLPVRGAPLAGLVALWLAGRIAVWFSADLGWAAAMVLDSAFLLAVAVPALIEIVAGRNWRNLLVLVPVTALFAANVLFHVEARFQGFTEMSRNLALAAGLVLIMVIGGRIIPSFTRNWLVRENPGRLPVPFNRFDGAVIVVSTLALLGWTISPEAWVSGALLVVAAILNAVRLSRWAGWRTASEPLLLILHVAYLFVPAGLLISGLAALDSALMPPVAGIHVFGIGAIGAMTLAVMARATLGHTGRELHAGGGTVFVFCAIVLATPFRFSAALMPGSTWLLHASATFWVLAFAGFVLCYAGALTRHRVAKRHPAAHSPEAQRAS